MIVPVPPIIVAEGLDIEFYDTVENAQLALEPWWVEQNLGKVYDSAGRLLQPRVGGGKVAISIGEEEPTHASELTSLLEEYLVAVGMPSDEVPRGDVVSLVRCSRKFTRQ